MTEPITNLNDAFDLFFQGGSVRLRLKEGITRETLLDEKLEKLKLLIPENPVVNDRKIKKLVVSTFSWFNPLRNQRSEDTVLV